MFDDENAKSQPRAMLYTGNNDAQLHRRLDDTNNIAITRAPQDLFTSALALSVLIRSSPVRIAVFGNFESAYTSPPTLVF